MPDLRITLIQPNTHWQHVDANLASLEEEIWLLDGETDLIMLPEMFNTGFLVQGNPPSELINGKTFKWMKQMAAQTGAVVTGSLIIWDQSRFYNRLIWMRNDGSFSWYDKRHLFRMTGEDKVFSSGDQRLIEELNGWKIAPFICYDLRFPVWMRNRLDPVSQSPEYDLALIVANWPAARIGAWNVLLTARAIENSCYVAGVNRVGTDGEGVDYNGHSRVTGPRGELLKELSTSAGHCTVTLGWDDLKNYRNKFPSYRDTDHFSITS